MMKKQKSSKKIKESMLLVFLALAFFLILFIGIISAVDPVGPDSIVYNSNETKNAASAQMVNLSGGRILSMNITAGVQNPRWKAFVGNVIGSFTLDDEGGSTIYDWTLATITGRIYSTRTSGAVSWAGIECANNTTMEQENSVLNHTGDSDNITATFDDNTHDLFWVGTVSISDNSCPTLNTYVSNSSQDTLFQEMVLYDGTANIVYATIIEEDEVGYDGETYDFQMIVPENGTPGFNSATAYYLYIELGN